MKEENCNDQTSDQTSDCNEQLTHHEVQQLKAAGFDECHIADVQIVKEKAAESDKLDWADLLTKLIENGPKIIALVKLFGGLFSKH